MRTRDHRPGSSRSLEPRRSWDRLVENDARRPRIIGRLSLGIIAPHGLAEDLDEGDPRLWRNSAAAKRRDRKARLLGLAYLLTAAGLAVLHDEVMTLPPGRFGHSLEQIMLGSMLVLGMLGGLLLFEGRRLFEVAIFGPSDHTRPKWMAPKRAARQVDDGSQWDTRSGVAMFFAKRAITTAAPPRDLTDDDTLDRRSAS